MRYVLRGGLRGRLDLSSILDGCRKQMFKVFSIFLSAGVYRANIVQYVDANTVDHNLDNLAGIRVFAIIAVPCIFGR